MAIEIETRTLIRPDVDVVSRLHAAGFEELETKTQIDVIHDLPSGELFLSGRKIRIRVEGDKLCLTYKGEFLGDQSVGRREEFEVFTNADQVDELSTILDRIGYPLLFRISKSRRTFRSATAKATIDDWPIIGSLLELEGEESEIVAIARKHFGDHEFKNYRLKELFEMKCKEEGKPFSELQREYEKQSGFELGNLGFLIR